MKLQIKTLFGLVTFTTIANLAMSPVSLAGKPESWNFTPKDYGILIKKHKKLTFAKDSAWLPSEVKKNLTDTLKFVLNPRLIPASTNGVNNSDLYHGHLACDGKSEGPSIMGEAEAQMEGVFQKRGLEWFQSPTSETLTQYNDAIREMEGIYSQALKKVFSEKICPRPVVIYHTYEFSMPKGMSVSDPHRNLLTRFGADAPEYYRPPNPDSASSWEKEFADLLQFAFLIDQKGVVHVTWGSTAQLSRVTGKPER